jgi:class 3 adenylate cyclase/sensor domain CHASE-containing protein
MSGPTRRGSSLAIQTLALVCAATLALTTLICVPLRALVLSRFESIEHELGEQDLARARNALDEQISALHAQARDYAAWDETWEFLGGERPQYADVNWVDETFAQNRIGLVVVVDTSGHEHFAQTFDLHGGAPRGALAHEDLFPSSDDVLFAHRRDGDTEIQGLAATAHGVYMVGAHAVLTSERTGPPRGTLVMGRLLDAPEIARLAETLALDVTLAPPEPPFATRDLDDVRAALRAPGDTAVRPIDDDTLGGYALLPDVRGEPCAILRVTTPRTVLAQGREDADFIAGSVAGALALFGAIILVLLQWVVVRRVARLGQDVSRVGAAADHTLRVVPDGDDEIGALGRDVNGMLASLERLHGELDKERAKAERLLRNILPASIAERLKDHEQTIADSFPEVSVLFADIVGFTELSGRVDASELVVLLNDIFSRFDALAEKHGLEKIKTIGDAYMIVAGLPEPRPDHAEALATMALDMQEALAAFNAEHGTALQIRVGINTGPVVAGVIGTKKFIYDLWGDAVNIASRMESSGVAGRVQVSESTAERLRGKLALEERGTIKVKGKGEMKTWLLVARHGEGAGDGAVPPDGRSSAT